MVLPNLGFVCVGVVVVVVVLLLLLLLLVVVLLSAVVGGGRVLVWFSLDRLAGERKTVQMDGCFVAFSFPPLPVRLQWMDGCVR